MDGGEREAFETIYHRYFGRVLQTVRARLGPALRVKVDSMDVMQSAFREALEHIDQLEHRSEGMFLHWINSIVANKVREKITHYRAQKRDLGREQSLGEEHAPAGGLHAAAIPSPSEIVSLEEEWGHLLACMDQLPDREREVILLKRFESMSWEEVASELGVPVPTARSLEIRAKARLVQCVGRNADRPGQSPA